MEYSINDVEATYSHFGGRGVCCVGKWVILGCCLVPVGLKKNQRATYFTSKVGLFGKSRGIAIQDRQTIKNCRQV